MNLQVKQLKNATIKIAGSTMNTTTVMSKEVSVLHLLNMEEGKGEFNYSCKDHSYVLKASNILLRNDGAYLFYDYKFSSLEDWVRRMYSKCLDLHSYKNMIDNVVPPPIWWRENPDGSSFIGLVRSSVNSSSAKPLSG
ncbi:hypothetical protein COLO4_16462 [Corchorus olitorius]|uniref:Uncharacterized protein n=1 Tax=Corchorus olitorius TaxID=93759 RepID=A0A1R3JHD6_9ROSI|nr:hypothetical protein COLO4_16462 [Corchorus olitorius]